MPKVSVIIPTHNRPDYLPRAIQSVLNQTYQDFEIIVVDDGLKIRAEEIITKINNPKIKYIQHEQEKGGAAARNTGIKAAQGEFIAFLDDDDEWLPEKLEKQVKALEESDESVSLVFTGLSIYDKNNKILNTRLPNLEGKVQPFERTLRRCFIWTSCMMMRKSFTDKGYIFDEKLKKNQEWDLQLRLLKVSKFYAINKPLLKLNLLDEDEHMGGQKNLANIIDGWEVFLTKHMEDYKKYNNFLALQYFKLSLLYRDFEKFNKARSYMLKAWLLKPYDVVYLKHCLGMLLGRSIYKKVQEYLKNK